ncbi:MAG: phosphatidate cytidylyltransferase [Methylococcaceae bacterium]|nr:phosphatidate cytidylyltransferase [Methylococcaceae bacterium]
MLKNRIVTALILAPIIVLAILVDHPWLFALVWGIVIAVCAWEWSNLAGLVSIPVRGVFVAVCVGIMASYQGWAGEALDWLAWPVVAWWFLISILLRRIPAKLLEIQYPLGVKLAIGFFVLVTSWILMVWTQHNMGGLQTLYLFLLIWLADVAAYFTGKQWGVNKLAPEISPGKTVEGLYGALLAGVLFAVVTAIALYVASVGTFTHFEAFAAIDFIVLSAVTVLISVVGDLFESLVKRIRGVKDSGIILPGHGGLLDRVDSLIAAVSVFYAGSQQLGIFFQ